MFFLIFYGKDGLHGRLRNDALTGSHGSEDDHGRIGQGGNTERSLWRLRGGIQTAKDRLLSGSSSASSLSLSSLGSPVFWRNADMRDELY